MGDAAATLRSIGVTGQLQQSQHCPQWNDYGDWIDWRAFSPLQHKLQGVLHLFPSTGSVTWGFWMKNCDFNEKHQGKMVTLYKQMVIQIGYLDSVAGLTHWTNGSHYMRHVDMVECAKHFQVQYQHMSMKQSQYVGITITVVFLPLKKHLISFWHDLTMKHGEPRTTWICQPDTLGNSPMSSSTCHVVSSKKRQNNAWRCWFQIGCTCTVHLIVTINIYIYDIDSFALVQSITAIILPSCQRLKKKKSTER